ncbi:High-affinity glucose transporter [Cyphellophora attinorum]|uniref:High-affinity glucose transporter n=1 Tax=Cyphellophora attinorum TaxID=1664694 RepID=A0A0N1HRM1_9EURO|nr:High-affinity glucose transporter [Phialophora attinorum]KPI40972.1 High-affinity glucose transporter [Phialophora attinorum]
MAKHTKSLYSTWVALFLSIGSVACAYFTVITATTSAQPSFVTYMHLDTASNATQLLGAVNGVYIAGALIGSILSSYATDTLGRRKSLSLTSALATVGGILQTGSVNMGMFIAARLIAGFGIGAIFALVPLFQSEIAPPTARGLLVGTHGIMISLGTVLPNWIGLGFYYVNASGAQWRPPLGIMCIFTLALAVGVWFVPESPRWLINKDRHEDAIKSLIRYHRNKDDPDNLLALSEYGQIKAQHDEDEKNKVTWKDMFTVPTYRRRAGVAAFVMIGSQMAATLLTQVYNPVLYGRLGFGVPMQLVFTGIWANFTIIGNTICAFTIDRMGRILALKIGWIGNALA